MKCGLVELGGQRREKLAMYVKFEKFSSDLHYTLEASLSRGGAVRFILGLLVIVRCPADDELGVELNQP